MRNIARAQLKRIFGEEFPDRNRDGEFDFALVELHGELFVVIRSRLSGESEVVSLRIILALALYSELPDEEDEPQSPT
jgi:hypothetical protein